jgi:hypothetical protein
MSHGGWGGVLKVQKKCHVLFEWPLRHPQKSDNVDITLIQLTELTLQRMKYMFYQKDPLHGDTLLHSAIEGEQYEVLQKIVHLVINRLKQITICNFKLI